MQQKFEIDVLKRKNHELEQVTSAKEQMFEDLQKRMKNKII